MDMATAELRWSPRHRASEPLTVFLNGHPVAATLCDLSIGGMRVETGAIRLPHNAQVYVHVAFSRNGETAQYRFEARVVRLTERGAGLMFSDFGPATMQDRRALLDSLAPPHGHRAAGPTGQGPSQH